MTFVNMNGKDVYIHPNLYSPLMDLKHHMQSSDDDYVCCVCGETRVGKSTLTMQLATFCDPTFPYDTSRVCFTIPELVNTIANGKKCQSVVFDEAFKGVGTVYTMSRYVKRLRSIFQEMGQNNMYVFVVLPRFKDVPEWLAKDRSKGAFIVYQNSSRQKGYYKYYKGQNKDDYWDFLRGDKKFAPFYNFRGNATSAMPIDDELYRKRKRESFLELADDTDLKDDGEVGSQRDKMIWLMHHKFKMNYSKIMEEFAKLRVDLDEKDLDKILARVDKALARMEKKEEKESELKVVA